MGRAMDNRRVCVCVSAGDHHHTPDPLMPGKLLPDVLERPNEGLSVPFVSLLTISYA